MSKYFLCVIFRIKVDWRFQKVQQRRVPAHHNNTCFICVVCLSHSCRNANEDNGHLIALNFNAAHISNGNQQWQSATKGNRNASEIIAIYNVLIYHKICYIFLCCVCEINENLDENDELKTFNWNKTKRNRNGTIFFCSKKKKHKIVNNKTWCKTSETSESIRWPYG